MAGLRCDEIEAQMGIEGYGTETRGVGGIVKKTPEDFIVSEILEGGLDAETLWSMAPLPMEPTRYTLWILKKRNSETVLALAELAKMLGVRPSKSMLCGIKDRRAMTYQFVALPLTRGTAKVDSVLIKRGEARRIGYIDGLDSSRLTANRFEVVVKGAEAEPSLLEQFSAEAHVHGVPNFYGPQRFGLLRPVTHLVGGAIVKGDLRGAVETLLGYSTDFEPEPARRARRFFAETGDYASSLNYFPRSLVYERRILKHLSERAGDYVGALRKLPLRIRRLFVDAYSAYLFNKALSQTLREGLKPDEPAVGDLFIRMDRLSRPYGRPLQVTASNIDEVRSRASEGQVALAIPSPGYLSWIPGGPRGEVLKNILDEEGVSLKSFRVRGLPEASTSGLYRPISLKPQMLSLESLDNHTVKVSLRLPPAGYATSLLRELMKRRCALAYIGVEHCYA
ncbi:MAG: tRNA pseudouridine(13) synthase TruD [Aigarchaeota archaeon]|nr:tRNA pseudouridine(13) synthase TruD [Candidatus Calditenuaceae archaeon]